MLVLSRELGQSIVIGDPGNEITILIVEVRGNDKPRVRIGISAPTNLRIRRGELPYEPMRKESRDDLNEAM